jgi:hypothetical protein
MAKGRMLLKTISESEGFATLKNDVHRLIYLMLLPYLDVQGRCKGNALLISHKIFPLLPEINEKVVSTALRDMVKKKLILWYEVEDRKYIEFPSFADHQPGLRPDKEPPSVLPPCNSVQIPTNTEKYGKIPKIRPDQTRPDQDTGLAVSYFKEFWNLYPNKKNKKKSLQIWQSKTFALTESKFIEIMSGLEKAVESDNWKKDKGRYIPLPTTFLNGERWNDEYTKTGSGKNEDY